MKNLIALFVVALLAVSASFATNPYGLLENPQVSGTVTISSEVLYVPIVIAPPSNSITLVGLPPGGERTYGDNDNAVMFNVTSAKGYGLKVSLKVNTTEHNGMTIVPIFKWGPDATSTTAWAPIPSGTGVVANITGTEMASGAAVVYASVRKITAAVGAHVGARTFTITAAAEYE